MQGSQTDAIPQRLLTSAHCRRIKGLRAGDLAHPERAKLKLPEVPMAVQAIPQGFHSVTPGLTCRNAAQAIELYKTAFGALERSRMASPDGKIMHAEIQIGDSMIFLADEYPGMSAAPSEGAPPSQAIYLYVQDVDSVYKQAVAAGCKEAMPVADKTWRRPRWSAAPWNGWQPWPAGQNPPARADAAIGSTNLGVAAVMSIPGRGFCSGVALVFLQPC